MTKNRLRLLLIATMQRTVLTAARLVRSPVASTSRFSSTFVPAFAPTGSTSAATKVPYGDPSLASSAYLPTHPGSATTTELTDASTTETPSDLTPKQRTLLERIIRVDQAGELGANYIYMGQLAVLSRGKEKATADLVQVSRDRVSIADAGPSLTLRSTCGTPRRSTSPRLTRS